MTTRFPLSQTSIAEESLHERDLGRWQILDMSRFPCLPLRGLPLFTVGILILDIFMILAPFIIFKNSQTVTTRIVVFLLLCMHISEVALRLFSYNMEYRRSFSWVADLIVLFGICAYFDQTTFWFFPCPPLTVVKAVRISSLVFTYFASSLDSVPNQLSRVFCFSLSWRFCVLIALTSLVLNICCHFVAAEDLQVYVSLLVSVFVFGGFLLLADSVKYTILHPITGFLDRINKLTGQLSTSVRTRSGAGRLSTYSLEGSFVECLISDDPFEIDIKRLTRVTERLDAYLKIHEKDTLIHSDTDLAVMHSVGVAKLDHPIRINLQSHISTKPVIGFDSQTISPLLRSWEFNPLNLSPQEQDYVIDCIIFRQEVFPLDRQTFHDFLSIVRSQYRTDNPYHRFEHALDVCHTVNRYLQLSDATTFLRSVDRAGLLIASLIHDIGHPGLNNLYLVETANELALRFNDKSPLENYHCSIFFEIATQTNLLEKFSMSDQRELRRLIIDAVLHTDNAFHFSIVKEVSVFNEIHADELQTNRVELLNKPDSRVLINRLFLHAADISNPTKPFDICRDWAILVMEEFFNQGDLERAAGIPVLPLNDRTKVDIPLSQMGFTEFVVAPLFLQNLRLFPMFSDSCQFMIRNMVQWAAECPLTEDKTKLLDRCSKLAESFRAIPGMGGIYIPESIPTP